jgi:ribonuclease HI
MSAKKQGKKLGSGAGFVTSEGYMEAIPMPKDSTNNEAEYQAVIGALKYLLRNPPVEFVQILSDSELVIKQINGDYKVKNSRLQKLHQEALSLIEKLSWLELGRNLTLKHIPREENTRADGLARVAALLSMAQQL